MNADINNMSKVIDKINNEQALSGQNTTEQPVAQVANPVPVQNNAQVPVANTNAAPVAQQHLAYPATRSQRKYRAPTREFLFESH